MIPGDGIGRDVADAAQNVLAAVNHISEEFTFKDVLPEGKVRTYDLGGNSSTRLVAEAVSEKIMKD